MRIRKKAIKHMRTIRRLASPKPRPNTLEYMVGERGDSMSSKAPMMAGWFFRTGVSISKGAILKDLGEESVMYGRDCSVGPS